METTVIILFFLALCLSLFKPLLGIYSFIAIAYIRPQDYFPILNNFMPARLIIFVTLISYLFNQFRSGKKNIPTKQNLGLFLIFLSISLSRIKAIDSLAWWSATLDFILILIFYFLLTNLITSYKKLQKFYRAFLCINFFIAIRYIYAYKTGTAVILGGRLSDASMGFLGNADDMGLGMVVAFAYGLIPIFFSEKIITKILYGITATCFMLAAVISGSRGTHAGITAVFIISILTFLKPRRLNNKKFIFGLLLVLTLFIFFSTK